MSHKIEFMCHTNYATIHMTTFCLILLHKVTLLHYFFQLSDIINSNQISIFNFNQIQPHVSQFPENPAQVGFHNFTNTEKY